MRRVLALSSLLMIAACAAATDDSETGDEADLTASADVIFSPQAPETSHLVRIAQLIDGAKTSIDVAIYSYSDSHIADALKRAVDRGVKVRLIFNDANDQSRAADKAATASGKIEASGVHVRFMNHTMHHKFIIIDGPRDDLKVASKTRLVSGSANWSSSAATRYDENTLFFSGQSELALRFQREFNLLWSHARDFGSKQFDADLSKVDIQDSDIKDKADVDVIFTSANFKVKDTTFSNTGTSVVADAMVAAINKATKSIHVSSDHMRMRPIAEALVARKAANAALDIKVYLDDQEYISTSGNAEQVASLKACLDKAGSNTNKQEDCNAKGFLFGYHLGQEGKVDVKYKFYAYRWNAQYAPQNHDKYMIVDGETLFAGSYNLSDNAEHDTFENMMIFTGATGKRLATEYEKNFATIWETGKAEGRLDKLSAQIAGGGEFPLVFDPMALTWSEVGALKSKIHNACPLADSADYRMHPQAHMTCKR